MVTIGLMLSVMLLVAGTVLVRAALGYADPQFNTQWDQGEALAPNF